MPTRDTNAVIAALLRDMAAVQASPQSRFGYKGAARAIMTLDLPIETMIRADGTLPKIAGVGPSSLRVIAEVLATGGSEIVERAVTASGRRAEVERSRALRGHYLSRARTAEVLAGAKRGGVRRQDYRGDLQMHSTWSDGTQTLADIVAGGIERGYEYCAVTDHSYGLPIAGGLSMAQVQAQHREIEALNARLNGRFRLLKGIEANIRADGSIDMTRDELRRFDLVVAAPHSALRSTADQTPRMLAAVRAPGVHILGHPRGRMYGSRPGVGADWDAVFAAAAQSGVAIEIDGDPARQDVDYALARRARDAGCLFALDSDAHAVAELRYADTAIAHARLAGIPAERVINTWPVDRLLQWAAGHPRR